MYTYTVVRRPFVLEGNEIMRLRISVPSGDIPRQIADFYSNMSINFTKWCESVEFPRISAEYTEGSKEKYIYKARLYSFDCEISFSDSAILSVLCRATKDGAVLFSEYHCWDVGAQLLLPPKLAMRLMSADKAQNSEKFSK